MMSRRFFAVASSFASALNEPLTPPLTWPAAENHEMAGIADAISLGRPALLAIASNLPTAHALALSISFTSFIMSLFETMLRFEARASIDGLHRVRGCRTPTRSASMKPNAMSSGVGSFASLVVMGDEALAVVFGDLRAVLDRERFEPRRLVTGAGEDEEGTRGVVRHAVLRHHRGDDRIHVLFEVEAGLLFELVLVVLRRLEVLEPLAELGVHHLAHVGVGDDGRIGRNILKFFRTGGARKHRNRQAHV